MPPARDPLVRGVHYRRFRNGLLDMSIFTHDDEVALMQQLPYIIGRSEYNRDSQLTRLPRGAAVTVAVYWLAKRCLTNSFATISTPLPRLVFG